MYCVHLSSSPPTRPVERDEYHWLDVGDGMSLMVHADCHHCIQPETRLSHVLKTDPVGAAVASALAAHGVLATDTLLAAMMKVAPSWPPAWP